MKAKKILVLGVGVVGFGALCASNTFAVVDTITVTVGSSCTFTVADYTPSSATSIANGAKNSAITTRDLVFKCNNPNGWRITAVGSGEVSGDVTKMKPSTVAVANAIATGTAVSGATSNWAFKITNPDSNVNIVVRNGYGSFSNIPATAAVVASNCTNNDSSCTPAATISGGKIRPTYQVYISPTQAADTYTGKVTYTIIGSNS